MLTNQWLGTPCGSSAEMLVATIAKGAFDDVRKSLILRGPKPVNQSSGQAFIQ